MWAELSLVVRLRDGKLSLRSRPKLEPAIRQFLYDAYANKKRKIEEKKIVEMLVNFLFEKVYVGKRAIGNK